jgi:hypothetical protein
MTALKFPFWIVTQRRGLILQPVEPDGMPGFAATFLTAEDAAKFMVARGETEWENRLVTGMATLQNLIADLRQIGMQGVCFDPAKGGGEKVPFDEMGK